jgi:nitrite reductase/ring-hydroxylating ferredoxin subunit
MSEETKLAWQRVASLSAMIEGEAIAARLGEVPVAVIRAGGDVYVIDDVCTHEYALLSSGFVDGCIVECPLHQATFDIRTGRCLSPPADADLRTYAVRIEGDDVLAAPRSP